MGGRKLKPICEMPTGLVAIGFLLLVYLGLGLRPGEGALASSYGSNTTSQDMTFTFRSASFTTSLSRLSLDVSVTTSKPTATGTVTFSRPSTSADPTRGSRTLSSSSSGTSHGIGDSLSRITQDVTLSMSRTAEWSQSRTKTLRKTKSPSVSGSVSATVSVTVHPTLSEDDTMSKSVSLTRSLRPTPSATWTATPTTSASPSRFSKSALTASATASASSSVSSSITLTITPPPTFTPTTTTTPSPLSRSGSNEASGTWSLLRSLSSDITASKTATITPPPTSTLSSTSSMTADDTATATLTVTPPPTVTLSVSVSVTRSGTPATRSWTASASSDRTMAESVSEMTSSVSSTVVPTPTVELTYTWQVTTTPTYVPHRTRTATFTTSASAEDSVTRSVTRTAGTASLPALEQDLEEPFQGAALNFVNGALTAAAVASLSDVAFTGFSAAVAIQMIALVDHCSRAATPPRIYELAYPVPLPFPSSPLPGLAIGARAAGDDEAHRRGAVVASIAVFGVWLVIGAVVAIVTILYGNKRISKLQIPGRAVDVADVELAVPLLQVPATLGRASGRKEPPPPPAASREETPRRRQLRMTLWRFCQAQAFQWVVVLVRIRWFPLLQLIFFVLFPDVIVNIIVVFIGEGGIAEQRRLMLPAYAVDRASVRARGPQSRLPDDQVVDLIICAFAVLLCVEFGLVNLFGCLGAVGGPNFRPPPTARRRAATHIRDGASWLTWAVKAATNGGFRSTGSSRGHARHQYAELLSPTDREDEAIEAADVRSAEKARLAAGSAASGAAPTITRPLYFDDVDTTDPPVRGDAISPAAPQNSPVRASHDGVDLRSEHAPGSSGNVNPHDGPRGDDDETSHSARGSGLLGALTGCDWCWRFKQVAPFSLGRLTWQAVCLPIVTHMRSRPGMITWLTWCLISIAFIAALRGVTITGSVDCGTFFLMVTVWLACGLLITLVLRPFRKPLLNAVAIAGSGLQLLCAVIGQVAVFGGTTRVEMARRESQFHAAAGVAIVSSLVVSFIHVLVRLHEWLRPGGGREMSRRAAMTSRRLVKSQEFEALMLHECGAIADDLATLMGCEPYASDTRSVFHETYAAAIVPFTLAVEASHPLQSTKGPSSVKPPAGSNGGTPGVGESADGGDDDDDPLGLRNWTPPLPNAVVPRAPSSSTPSVVVVMGAHRNTLVDLQPSRGGHADPLAASTSGNHPWSARAARQEGRPRGDAWQQPQRIIILGEEEMMQSSHLPEVDGAPGIGDMQRIFAAVESNSTHRDADMLVPGVMPPPANHADEQPENDKDDDDNEPAPLSEPRLVEQVEAEHDDPNSTSDAGGATGTIDDVGPDGMLTADESVDAKEGGPRPDEGEKSARATGGRLLLHETTVVPGDAVIDDGSKRLDLDLSGRVS